MSIEALFEYRQQTCKDDASLSVSYMEIYRDEVYDLLVDRETVGHIFAPSDARRTCLSTDSCDDLCRPLNYRSGRMMLAKSLLQTYHQHRFKTSTSSISYTRTHSLESAWFGSDQCW